MCRWNSRLSSAAPAVLPREFELFLSSLNDLALLGKLNLTPQKPLQRACQRDPEGQSSSVSLKTYLAIARHKTRLVKTMCNRPRLG